MVQDNVVSFEDTSKAFSHKSDGELRKMHMLFSLMNWKHPAKIGTYFVKSALKYKLPVKTLVKNTLFRQFCGGESLEECRPLIHRLKSFNIKVIPDYAAEGEKSEEGFNQTFENVLDTVDFAGKEKNIAFAVFKVSGMGSGLLLEKVQAGSPLNEKENEDFSDLSEKINIICHRAEELDVSVMIDAEESWIQGSIDVLAYSMMNKYNKKKAIVYNTFQMYRADMLNNLRDAIAIARKGGFFLGVKLVRGAYIDIERKRAETKGYRSPIWDTKKETDLAFNQALELCIQNLDHVALLCGSHNEDSNLYLSDLMMKHAVAFDDKRVFFSQLYGMGDHISFNLASAGFNVAKYVPYGPVEAAMPYLFRRANENQAMMGQTSRELNLIKKEISRRNSATE
ncbi:MAG: proline dehydrogenase family protein [Cytophagaceae bacterium]